MKVVTAIPWLILATLVIAVLTMFTWWQVASIQVTGSTTWIFMFATMGLWFSLVFFALALWRLFLLRGNAVKKSVTPDLSLPQTATPPPSRCARPD